MPSQESKWESLTFSDGRFKSALKLENNSLKLKAQERANFLGRAKSLEHLLNVELKINNSLCRFPFEFVVRTIQS